MDNKDILKNIRHCDNINILVHQDSPNDLNILGIEISYKVDLYSRYLVLINFIDKNIKIGTTK